MNYLWESSSGPKPISLHLLKEITEDFSESTEIGRGAYGVVHKVSHTMFVVELIILCFLPLHEKKQTIKSLLLI